MQFDTTVENRTVEKQVTSKHLVSLPGGTWQLWHTIGLRSTGFPIEQVANLIMTDSVVMADSYLKAEKKEKQVRQQAHRAVENELENLRLNQEWSVREKRLPLVNAIKALHKGNMPTQDIAYAPVAATAVQAYKTACQQRLALHQKFQQTFAAEIPRSLANFRKIIQAQRFQEAVIWQNRHAYQTGIRKLVTNGVIHAPTKKQRERISLAANYLHRYCTKNDTIGFFGPVGWAHFLPSQSVITVQPGPTLLANREAFFEQWCIEAFVDLINQGRQFHPWIPPRPHPYIALDGNELYKAYQGSTIVSPKQAAVLNACLAACDGLKTAQEVITELRQLPIFAQKSETALYAFLEHLHKSGIISWKLQLPFDLHLQHELKQFLEPIEDKRKEPLLNNLDRLEQARRNVTQAVGDPQALISAVKQVENIFTEATNTEATRLAGKMYAGRTLIYEDCRRDITVNIGSDILAALGYPLSLLLTSARWYTFETSVRYRQAFVDIYQSLASQTDKSQVNLANFWQHAQSILLGSHIPLIQSVTSNFQERWAEVLAIPPEQHRIHYTSEELQSKVEAAFVAPHPGWQFARYHSPDVMIAAKDVAAIQQGQYELVMGEFHIGTNSLGAACFANQHPAPETLLKAVQEDIPHPRIIPLQPADWPELTSRTHPAFTLEKDFRLAFTPDSGGMPQSQILPVASLIVTQNGDTLIVQTRDGQEQFDIIEVFADALLMQAINQFKILPPFNHTPRITIDRLVVCREAWHLPAKEMTFAWEKDEPGRFLGSRRWAQTRGLPQFVFVKSPIERKPFYVDFENAYSLNIFTKTIRRTAEVTDPETVISITEMLPTPSQVWLPDAQGRRYTSELRIVAVDSVELPANKYKGDSS